MANQYKKKKKKSSTGIPEAGKAGRFFSDVLDGSLLTRKSSSDTLPFIIYLSGLALFLIFNTYYAEKQAREVDQLRRELTELRVNYVSTKSQYMYLTNRSELAQRLSDRGFIVPLEPPGLIYDTSRRGRFWRRLF